MSLQPLIGVISVVYYRLLPTPLVLLYGYYPVVVVMFVASVWFIGIMNIFGIFNVFYMSIYSHLLCVMMRFTAW